MLEIYLRAYGLTDKHLNASKYEKYKVCMKFKRHRIFWKRFVLD